MKLEELRGIALQLPGVTEDIKWEDHLCFNIGGKMFLITSPDQSPVTASFKARAEELNELCEREGFTPAPYLARYKWVYVDDINRIKTEEWEYFVAQAYQLIMANLPKKVQTQLLDK